MIRTILQLSDSESVKIYGDENDEGEVVPLDVVDQESGEIVPRDVWMNDHELYNRIENSIREAA
jgi:hypothetical protein